MRLLVAIVHREDVLDDVLSALVEAEAPDAVVVESRSGLELLERDLPIFAGLRTLVPSGIDFSALVVCAIADDRRAAEALATVSRIEVPADGGASGPENTVLLLPIEDLTTF
jgi:hypothetical protein